MVLVSPSAEALAWTFAGVSLLLSLLLVVALLGDAHLAAENRRLRSLIHPSTRRTHR